VGKTIPFIPTRTASLFTSYTLDNGISFGGGLRYVNSVATAYDGSTQALPAYTLIDASAGYAFGRWRAQLNLKNLFDKHYYINNYQTLFFGNVVGEPRSVSVSLRTAF
jgi:iron complex outermembrane receptor protein